MFYSIYIDAPRHFIKDGRSVDALALDSFIGRAFVAEHSGVVTEDDAKKIITKAREIDPLSEKRILIKGDAEVSAEAASVFLLSGVLLLGCESQSVGPQDAPMAVHIALLSAGVVLLEGIRLSEVSEGAYFLNAAPLNLFGADGAPCRAVLMETDSF